MPIVVDPGETVRLFDAIVHNDLPNAAVWRAWLNQPDLMSVRSPLIWKIGRG